MFVHGRLNSRMKDCFDILLLSRHFPFDGARLADAIRATLARRKTPLHALPVGLTPEFAAEPGKQAQWAAFLRRIRATDQAQALHDAIAEIGRFLLPVLAGLVHDGGFAGRWAPRGAWVHSDAT